MNKLLRSCRRLLSYASVAAHSRSNFGLCAPPSNEKLSLSFRRTFASVESSDNLNNVLPGPCLVFSEDENMLRDTVRKFAQSSIAPKVKDMDEKAETDKELVNQLFANGLMGLEVPVEYGGSGLTFTEACIVIEEIAKVDPAVSVLVDVHNTVVNTAIRKWANPDQKKKWLTALATDTVGSFCLSEAGSGSDAFALKTRASDKGDHFVIDGGKLWISNAMEAGLFIVFANANPEKGHKGITAFIIDSKNPGLTIAKKEDKLGIRASSTCELVFQNAKVPKEDILGEVGTGYKIAIESLNEGRIGIGAQMIGIAQGCFDLIFPYLHERKQFGSRIGDFQGVQFQYAKARVELEAARALVYNAARMNDAGLPIRKEAAFAKYYSAQVAERIASKSIDWAGGMGFVKEFGLEKYYRDVKIGHIYEGTDNIQLQTIAKEMQKEYGFDKK
ncbi:Short/branched chain specific acyl-CoA dehydrogenase, mitochondrial [Galdieria sulphuraria]|uniref:Short/branched chain specific acyl-CoA dehydrogenase, mitochondrial n=1 Tax=Galdieria sulphuraria TaxID=130081 RepID=M2Y4R5_GALSU|nr:butyryl-CoA dehydrogenase [Galdieria sulphuraria]EME30948.1 butyryl-CoA dehydrogenase [Galdieria sulphuraria]GJD10981.1 Short/branched chain specific acyl-CoA dehydrogenase, mitochondrial [Galdieria sulphuraria]|eukprot:XP_005707468.1 butyryl-CoA dehydrogenase [Galdieria sulphuraria]